MNYMNHIEDTSTNISVKILYYRRLLICKKEDTTTDVSGNVGAFQTLNAKSFEN